MVENLCLPPTILWCKVYFRDNVICHPSLGFNLKTYSKIIVFSLVTQCTVQRSNLSSAVSGHFWRFPAPSWCNFPCSILLYSSVSVQFTFLLKQSSMTCVSETGPAVLWCHLCPFFWCFPVLSWCFPVMFCSPEWSDALFFSLSSFVLYEFWLLIWKSLISAILFSFEHLYMCYINYWICISEFQYSGYLAIAVLGLIATHCYLE